MRKLNLNNFSQKVITALVLFLMLSVVLTGCGESGITDLQSVGSLNKSAGVNSKVTSNGLGTIQLDMVIKFKSESIEVSKILESNSGNNFNNIVSFTRDIKPGEILDLQVLQEAGIFGLYLSSNGLFTLYNSDGLEFSSKTVLMEKCSFIDLKVLNQEQKTITVTGLVAGE